MKYILPLMLATRSRLNTFLQFWFMPLAVTIVAAAENWRLIDALRKGYWKLKWRS